MNAPASRPVRLASQLAVVPENEAADILRTKRVLIGLERGDSDSVGTMLLALNEMLRICPNIGLALPDDLGMTVRPECSDLAMSILGTSHTVSGATMADAPQYDAALVVGETIRDIPGWIAVTSEGWIGRTSSWVDGIGKLPGHGSAPNPIGADVAASLGVGRVFRHLFGQDPLAAFELSGYGLASGPLGSQAVGPAVPSSLPWFDALLVGCGSVMHGWAHTVRRLPIAGQARAVDPQALGIENVGTYLGAGLKDVGRDKVAILKDALAPRILVTADRDFVELFSRRLEGALSLPPLVVAGLDDTGSRHVVQRWWPQVLIDMGTHGFSTQVLVKTLADEGMCLLDALPTALDETTGLQQAAIAAGITRTLGSAELLDKLDDGDVAAAPEALRAAMRAAKAAGTRRCSWILAAEVGDRTGSSFAAAAPFVAGLAGTLAAGRTLDTLMSGRRTSSVRMHASFASERAVVLDSHSSDECACRTAVLG